MTETAMDAGGDPSWLVRVLSAKGQVVGAGFYIGRRLIVTCAHVAAQAAGRVEPGVTITLNFASLPAVHHVATVLAGRWDGTDNDQSDVAVLELAAEPPAQVTPARLLKSATFWGDSFRVLGFPRGNDGGVWATGVLRGPAGPGWRWVQIEDTKSTGKAIEPGFSGTAVWDERLQGVVGLVVAQDRDRGARTAFMIPLDVVAQVWPPFSEYVELYAGRMGDTAKSLMQLPPDLGDFTGRAAQLSKIERVLLARRKDATAIVLTGIAGKGGVGKTTLAVHVAHRLRDRFPDGHLYLNLRGAEAEKISAVSALAAMLRALGVPESRIPESQADRVALYRATIAGRKVLLVLDNVYSEAHVRDLIPSDPASAVIITSRAKLTMLEGAHLLELDVFTKQQAVKLLEKILGRARVRRSLEDARRIAAACGHLPLAVRIAGGKLAAYDHWSLSQYAARLQHTEAILDELQFGDKEVRACFNISYDDLNDMQQRAFTLLGTIRAATFPSWVLGPLLEVDLPTAEDLTSQLVAAQLLEVARKGAERTRFRFHDLLREYSREKLRDLSEDDRRSSVRRLTRQYNSLAVEADRLIVGDFTLTDRRTLEDRAASRLTYRLSEVDPMASSDPMAWLRLERSSLMAVLDQARQSESWDEVYSLAASLSGYLFTETAWSDWERTQALALDAAWRSGARVDEGIAASRLAAALWYQSRWAESLEYMQRAQRIFEEIPEPLWRARILRQIGALHRDRGDAALAEPALTRSIDEFRQVRDEAGEALAMHSLAVLFRDQRRFPESLKLFQAAIPKFDRTGELQRAAQARRALALLHIETGDLPQATLLLEQALPVLTAIKDRLWRARVFRDLGRIAWLSNNPDEAMSKMGESVEEFIAIGDARGAAYTREVILSIAVAEGRYDQAAGMAEQLLREFAKMNDLKGQAMTLMHLGEASSGANLPANAIQYFRKAGEIFQELGNVEAAAKAIGRADALCDSPVGDD